MSVKSPKRDTRSQILRAAREIAERQGMRAATVRAVSEAAGVGMGTMRHHFKSQRELFAVLVAEVVDDRVDDSVMLDSSMSGADRLADAVGQLIPSEYADVSSLAAWFDVYASAFARPPSGYSNQLLEAASRRTHRHVRSWLVRLAREGWVEPARIDGVADTLVALASGLLLEVLTPGSPVTFDTARSTLALAARSVVRESPVPLGVLGPAARERFTSPTSTLPVAARDNPDRAVIVSDDSGAFQVYAWDRRSGVRVPVTNTVHGSFLCGISPDGSRIWTFEDQAGGEVGRWSTRAFPAGGEDVSNDARVLGIDPGIPLGHAIGNRRAVVCVMSDAGATVWIVDDPSGEARVRMLHQSPGMVSVYGMDPAEELVALGCSEGATALRPRIAVIRISDGVEVASLWDGPDSGLEATGFSPVAGDSRLVMTHEREGWKTPFIWNFTTDKRSALHLDHAGDTWARWYPDGEALLLAHTENGRTRLSRHELDGGSSEILPTPPGWIGTGAVRSDGVIEYLWCDAAHPPQHRMRLPDGSDDPVATTPRSPTAPQSEALHDAFLPVDGEPDARLHVLYATPPNGRAPHPTVFLIHGGPYAADEDFYSPTRAAWLDAGFAVVHVNYRGSIGYGRHWRDAIIGDPGRLAVADIARARDWAIEHGLSVPSQCVVEGWSWGGYLALLTAGIHPSSWMACIAGAPIADYRLAYDEQLDVLREFDRELFAATPHENPELYTASSPSSYADAFACPVLILFGRNDPRTPTGQIRAFTERLAEHGKPHETYEFDAGHGSLDVAETIRQTETEIGFALRRLLDTRDLPDASHPEPAGSDRS